MTRLLGRLWPLVLVAVGCSSDSYVIDPFRVPVSFDDGVPVLLGCSPELDGCDGPPRKVVIDTGTPITVVASDPGTSLARLHTSLDIEAENDVTRARFLGFTAFVQPMGPIGLEGATMDDPGVVLGGDRLQTLAVRLDPGAKRLFFFPSLAGANDVLARECSAVIPAPRLGGGEYIFDGSQIAYSATRLVIDACLNLDPNPDPSLPAEQRRPKGLGADALLVIATGLPMTVLSQSAWERACAVTGECTVGTGTLHLPGAAPGAAPDDGITVSTGTLSWLGIAADEVRDGRGPCGEVWASRMMDLGGCARNEPCLCKLNSDDLPCRAGASAEIGGPIQVAILLDTDPVMQALRDELRPGVADVDGFLGMNAFMPFVTDFDYPHSRLALRCQDDKSSTCVVRPRLPSFETRRELLALGCLGRQAFAPTVDGVVTDPTP